MSIPGAFATDTSHWPLVVLHGATRRVTNEELEEFVAGQKEMLARGERYVEICDTRGITMVPAGQRRLLADFAKSTHPEASKLCMGLAVVVPSPIIKGGMTAVLWMFSPSYPVRAFTTLEEAGAFLVERAESAGLVLPPDALDYLRSGQPLERHG